MTKNTMTMDFSSFTSFGLFNHLMIASCVMGKTRYRIHIILKKDENILVQRTKHQIYNVLVILHLFAEKTLGKKIEIYVELQLVQGL